MSTTKTETTTTKGGDVPRGTPAKEVLERATLVSVDQVVPNWWNMSAGLSAEADASLVEDMKRGGITAIDPIRVALLKNINKTFAPESKGVAGAIYVVVDGEQRLREAVRLKWPQIRAYVDEDIKSEADARAITFAKGNERASGIDPFKEAENYKWHRDQGETIEKIAERYRVDRTHVSHRLGFLNLSPEVKEQLHKNTRVSVSQIEPLTSLPAEKQKEISDRIVKQALSVREVEHAAMQARKEVAEEKEFQEKVAKSKFPKCPKDGKPAHPYWESFPMVTCMEKEFTDDYAHVWNANTGKTKEQEQAEERAKRQAEAAKERKENPAPPTTFKTSHTVEEFEAAGLAYVKELIARLDKISRIGGNYQVGLEGSEGKKDVVILFDTSTDGEVSLETQVGQEMFGFTASRGSWKSDELKDMKTLVEPSGSDDIKSEKDLEKLQREVIAWFEKYAPRPKAKAAKK